MAVNNTRTMVVPAYFTNTGGGVAKWTALNTAAATCRLIAIGNPNSGPGVATITAYTNAFNALITAGGFPIGYVYCENGARAAATVDAEVDSWFSFYPMIKGIFFDQNFDNTGAQLTYFEARYNYARSVISGAIVIGNHGTHSLHESYLSSASKADMYCVSEGDAADAVSYPSYVANYGRGNFLHLKYNGSAAQADSLITKGGANNIGNFFVTDDVLANPWDAPPAYLQTMASRIGPTRGMFF